MWSINDNSDSCECNSYVDFTQMQAHTHTQAHTQYWIAQTAYIVNVASNWSNYSYIYSKVISILFSKQNLCIL